MAVKLTAETWMTISEDDLLAVVTEYLCSGSYGALADLKATSISPNDASGGFDIKLSPIVKVEG